MPDILTTELDKNDVIDRIAEDLSALDQVVQTPQVMLAPDGESIITAPIFPTTDTENHIVNIKKEPEKTDLAVAMRNKQDLSKLISNMNEFGIHVTNTQGELESIKDMLFDGGITLDANAFLDLFNPNDSLSLDMNNITSNPDEDWPSSSVNENQLFNGSELISYNPNDVLNFDNLLEENEEESGLLE